MLEYNEFHWLQALEMHEECLEVCRKTCWNLVTYSLRTQKHCVEPLTGFSCVVWGYNMIEYNKFVWLQALEMHEECSEVCRKTCWNLVRDGLRTPKHCFEALNGFSSVVWGYKC